jgi:hypothetical protein
MYPTIPHILSLSLCHVLFSGAKVSFLGETAKKYSDFLVFCIKNATFAAIINKLIIRERK